MTSGDRPFPDHVLLRLGSAPRRDDGEDGLVLRGNGCVAKAGSGDRLDRERFVLSTLAPRLPVAVPTLLDAGTGWILLDDVADVGSGWAGDDLLACMADLAGLHREFTAHPVLRDGRLADPLGRDLDRLLGDAREAAPLVAPALPAVDALAGDPSPIVDMLRAEPPTLLHGDPWPPNVRRVDGAQRVWIDWSHAARGPGILDVATWLDQAPWALGAELDAGAHLDAYVAGHPAGVAEADRFGELLHAASLFWMLVVDVPRLARAGGDPELVAQVTGGRLPALARFGLA